MEARARVEIDRQLQAAGWAVQDADGVNLATAQGVAVREFVLNPPYGRADYLLFVDRQAVGSVEAKPAGTTLTGVEIQSARYRDNLPDFVDAPSGRCRFSRAAAACPTCVNIFVSKAERATGKPGTARRGTGPVEREDRATAGFLVPGARL